MYMSVTFVVCEYFDAVVMEKCVYICVIHKKVVTLRAKYARYKIEYVVGEKRLGGGGI